MTAAATGWRALLAEALLLLTAAIWGFAFVAQRQGMEHVGPFLFNALRFALGCLPLIPFVLRARAATAPGSAVSTGAAPVPRGGGVRLGVGLGILLFGGASLQQVGLQYTTVAKSGFITGLYVVLVPLLGAASGLRIGPRAWAGAGLAVLGLWFLTFGGDLGSGSGLGSAADSAGAALGGIGAGNLPDTAGRGLGDGTGGGLDSLERAAANVGDLLMLACALFWAGHILAVDRWARWQPWPQLAVTQFLTCAALSLATALVFEPIAWPAIAAALWPVLYAGLLSVGAGYTLQVVAQRDAPAAPAAVIMSLETVFAAVGGWWLLGERLGSVGLVGCGLMLAGMVLASLRRRS